MVGQFNEDIYVNGTLRANRIVLPTNSLGSGGFDGGDPLVADKQYHQYTPLYSQGRGAAPVSDTGKVVHVALDQGVVYGIEAGFIVAPVAWAGGGQVVVDLLKNGVSVLSGTITLVQATPVFTPQLGTVNPPGTYVGGDVFEVKITYAAGTGTPPQGVYARPVFRELPG